MLVLIVTSVSGRNPHDCPIMLTVLVSILDGGLRLADAAIPPSACANADRPPLSKQERRAASVCLRPVKKRFLAYGTFQKTGSGPKRKTAAGPDPFSKYPAIRRRCRISSATSSGAQPLIVL
jgi:hypothetical protein